MVASLVLLRHGESEFNSADRFAGRLDVPLTAVGCAQARRAGQLLAASGLEPDIVFTSPLARARDTARLVIGGVGRPLPLVVSAQLIERAYGGLEGLDRADVTREFGVDQVRAWRRGWDVLPPKRAGCESAESLADVSRRVLPYFRSTIEPEVRAGRCVVVVSHGNTLRVLVRHLEGLDERAAGDRLIPVGRPFRYRTVGPAGSLDHAARYLDAHAAQTGIGIGHNGVPGGG